MAGNTLTKQLSKMRIFPKNTPRQPNNNKSTKKRGLLSSLSPIKNRNPRLNKAPKSITLHCTSDHSTESLLDQLEAAVVQQQVTHLTLEDIIQRRDNVRLFDALQRLLSGETDDANKKKKRQTKLQCLTLVEPHVHAPEYRRWCYKKTNFLHHVYRTCQKWNIQVVIEGTLTLEAPAATVESATPSNCSMDASANSTSSSSNGSGSSLLSSWLSILQQLPQDPDITTLKIIYSDTCTSSPATTKSTTTKGATAGKKNGKPADFTSRQSRLSIIEMQLKPVQQLFQALIELFNSDTRAWSLVQIQILYQQVQSYAVPQTEALLEVAELFDIPLQVQWRPMICALEMPTPTNATNNNTRTGKGRKAPIWTRATTRAQAIQQGQSLTLPSSLNKEIDDTTASTVCGGSSGHLVGNLYF